jgi:hypothetical protein
VLLSPESGRSHGWPVQQRVQQPGRPSRFGNAAIRLPDQRQRPTSTVANRVRIEGLGDATTNPQQRVGYTFRAGPMRLVHSLQAQLLLWDVPELNLGEWVWRNIKHDRIDREGVAGSDDLKANSWAALYRLQWLPRLIKGLLPGSEPCVTSPPEHSTTYSAG